MNRRFLWTLLLALVLPFAQVAAAAHEVSHVRAAASDKSGVPAPHCDVCAVAAAVTGGGAASDAPVLLHAPVRHEQPLAQSPAPHAGEPIAFFLSRAPPSLR
ncbi:hypothetical protein [Ramlibacter sp. PS4R-6]|uniref:hypothetical protein n=1 Tax=Ramlibacter sp. PS4R-6 TaxID=3133438 RepID=UPI0030B649D7